MYCRIFFFRFLVFFLSDNLESRLKVENFVSWCSFFCIQDSEEKGYRLKQTSKRGCQKSVKISRSCTFNALFPHSRLQKGKKEKVAEGKWLYLTRAGKNKEEGRNLIRAPTMARDWMGLHRMGLDF